MRRLVLLIASVLYSTALSFGQGTAAAAIPITINQSGAPIPSVLVTVCTTNPGTGACPVKATTYTDITIGTACSGTLKALNNLASPSVGSGCSNPGFSDGLGNVLVFAAAGANWCQFSGSGLTTYSQPCIFPFAGVSSLAWQNVTGPGPSTTPLQMGSGGSLSPTSSGQIAATQAWMIGGIVDPGLSTSATGGSLPGNTNVSIQICFNTALGCSLPSRVISVSTPPCANICSATIPAPTLPSWAASYSAYSCSGIACSPLQQAASSNCVAITGSCLIQVVGAGAAPLTVQTAFVQPPGTQATECPPSVIPTFFVQDTAGNYHTQWGVTPFADNTNGPPTPGGTLLMCRRVEFNDDKTSPTIGKNAFVTINHNRAVGTVATNQDRALWVSMQNAAGDTSTWYSMAAIQDQLVLNGTPVMQAAPDGEVTAHSVQAQDSHTGVINSPAFGFNGVRISVTRPGAGTWGSCPDNVCIAGERVQVVNNNTAAGSAFMVGHTSKVTDVSGAPTGTFGIGYYAIPPAGGQRLNVNYGYFVGDYGTNAVDFAFKVDSTATNSSQSFFGGPVWFGQPLWGTILPRQITTPTNGFGIAVTCITTCTATYVYKLVPKDMAGGWTPATNTISTNATAATTLNGSNFNTVQMNTLPTNLPASGTQGMYAYDVYRFSVTGGSPSTLGYLGTMTCPTSSFTCSFVDNGVATSTPTTSDWPTPPAYNASGALSAYAFRTVASCAQDTTSPAACGAAPAGMFTVPTTTTTYTVNTTLVTINSKIFLQARTDATGFPTAPTCTAPAVTSAVVRSAISPGVSFTFTLPSTTGKTCWDYWIIG